MARQVPQTKKAAGATKPASSEFQGKIIEHLWWMKKNGYKESTIGLRGRHLKTLMKRGANLLDPETVKETIAKMDCIEDTKALYAATYDLFARNNGIAWDPPRYKQTDKLPFIPSEAEIDQLIAGCQMKTAALLQTLKETAMRIGEAWKLKWTDVDFERNVIRLNVPEKRSRARVFKASSKLIGMLNRLPRKSEKIWGYMKLRYKKANFRTTRKRIAAQLQNPRIIQITFHTLRHWKATILYHQTKDIIFVKEILGHKNINSTLKYVQLERTLFMGQDDEFHVKVARSLEEACKLIETGFEYVTDMSGDKLFRKRK